MAFKQAYLPAALLWMIARKRMAPVWLSDFVSPIIQGPINRQIYFSIEIVTLSYLDLAISVTVHSRPHPDELNSSSIFLALCVPPT